MPCLRKSRRTATCQIMPPRPGRSSHTVPGCSSHSTSIRPTITTVHLGDELDARSLVVLLLALDGVVVRAVEEGEDSALEPAALVRVDVRADERRRWSSHRRVGRASVLRDAGRAAGVYEVLEVRERLRDGEASERRRERVGEEGARDVVAGPPSLPSASSVRVSRSSWCSEISRARPAGSRIRSPWPGRASRGSSSTIRSSDRR